jgi:hypothetical protein
MTLDLNPARIYSFSFLLLSVLYVEILLSSSPLG